ncbi:hypothetical protein RSAG8_10982, partial [Rhizoctonia solani AG-8 WAC10335]
MPQLFGWLSTLKEYPYLLRWRGLVSSLLWYPLQDWRVLGKRGYHILGTVSLQTKPTFQIQKQFLRLRLVVVRTTFCKFLPFCKSFDHGLNPF